MRLDNYLVKKGFFDSRTKAKQAVEREEIFVNDKLVKKVSFEIKDENINIRRVCSSDYVSLGGFKMEKALLDFNYSVKDLVVADIGASAGGFTDCLLKNGAEKVFAVDLHSDLLHEKLRNNPRVVSVEKNARELTREDFKDTIDLIVADLSFISLSYVMGVFSKLIDDNKDMIILVKPQFETGQKQKFKNGIIKDKKIHKEVCKNVYDLALKNNLAPQKITTAPLVQEKNKEFLFLLKKGGTVLLKENFLDSL